MIKCDGKRYPSQFVSEMLDSLQKDSEDVLHNMSIPVCYHGNILVPDLPDVTGFAGHLWRSIVILPNGASSA